MASLKSGALGGGGGSFITSRQAGVGKVFGPGYGGVAAFPGAAGGGGAIGLTHGGGATGGGSFAAALPGAAGGGGAGGGGAFAFGGGAAGGGGYGVWKHAAYQPYQSPYIQQNFCHSVNYAYRPSVWGHRPWWGSSYNYSWHHGCWDYGWNSSWNHRYTYYQRPALYYPPGYEVCYDSPSRLIPWGLASWTLGRLAYDTGYYTYRNPYVAPVVTTGTTVIRYSEPITVIAANTEPASEEIAETAAEKSAAALERSRNAFRAGDYLAAASAAEEAISHAPGDPVLHEYRALVLFALGRYADATGVLHTVLASGPGWDWETLIGFYGEPDRYTDQFRKLEDYVVANPNSPEAHFLLGYHYMVGKNLQEAHAMFDRVVSLQPSDSVAGQLRSLLADSSAAPAPDSGLVPETSASMPESKKDPIKAESLHGIWKAVSAEGKTITLSITQIGTFSWEYEGAAEKVLKGEWSLEDGGLLVLAEDDVQMVGDITLKDDGSLHFLLAGSPEGDPGLIFKKE